MSVTCSCSALAAPLRRWSLFMWCSSADSPDRAAAAAVAGSLPDDRDDLGEQLLAPRGRTTALQQIGEALEHAVLERGYDGRMHIAAPANRNRIDEVAGGEPHRIEHLPAPLPRGCRAGL